MRSGVQPRSSERRRNERVTAAVGDATKLHETGSALRAADETQASPLRALRIPVAQDGPDNQRLITHAQARQHRTGSLRHGKSYGRASVQVRRISQRFTIHLMHQTNLLRQLVIHAPKKKSIMPP